MLKLKAVLVPDGFFLYFFFSRFRHLILFAFHYILMRMIVYNTLTKRMEEFRSREAKKVKLFTCGPSVYRNQHLGNYRTFVFEDVLQRYLEYLGYSVDRGINFTDLEDKTIEQSKEENRSVQNITKPVVDDFLTTAKKLRLFLPKVIHRSTTCVDQAVVLIKRLLERGHAYWYNGDVYFDPLTYSGFGEIFGLDMNRWPKKKVRFSKDTYPGNRWNLGDFILWHKYREGDPFVWETEIGKGRPGWNIQDPAIITQTLGHTIDIHCGGIDNTFRHHDYNRAIVESAYEEEGEEFAHYWVHGEHLIVKGYKMSKSKGNTIYPEDLFKEGMSGPEVRFILLYGHYREQMNITDAFLDQARGVFSSIQKRIRSLLSVTGKPGKTNPRAESIIMEIPQLFRTIMDDNLRVKEAVDSIHGVLKELESIKEEGGLLKKHAEVLKKELREIDSVLQVFFV